MVSNLFKLEMYTNPNQCKYVNTANTCIVINVQFHGKCENILLLKMNVILKWIFVTVAYLISLHFLPEQNIILKVISFDPVSFDESTGRKDKD